MPKISVIVPIFNVENYIRRCLLSIMNQSLSDIEIIVVDDYSPDNSMRIVQELSETDSRIRIVSHKKNMGLMWTRMSGYKEAKGEFVFFCDSDDYIPDNALKMLYEEALKTNADIVVGNSLYVRIDGTKEEWKSVLKYGSSKSGIIKSLLLNELRHNLCGKLFKSSLFDNKTIRVFENFTNGEDACLFYQITRYVNKIVTIDDIVYFYMQNMSSSTQVRYKNESIRSICITNMIRHEESKDYVDLETIRHKHITNVLYWLYSLGYSYDSNLNKYIKEYNLQEYRHLSQKYFTKKEILKFWIRRYVIGTITYLKLKTCKK